MLTTQDLHTVDEPEMGYGQLLNILVRRITWFGGAIAVSLGTAILLTIYGEALYESSMQLLVEPNYRQRVDITGEQDNQSALSQTDYVTQLNLMRSQGFIEQTVEQMLVEYPDLCSKARSQAHCVNLFRANLSLSQLSEGDVETRIFEAEFTDYDPAIAQAFLETLGQVYLKYNEEQQEESIEQGLALVNQQIGEVQAALERSRQELKRFRESENLIDPQGQGLQLASTLKDVQRDQIEVENEYRDTSARYLALQEQLAEDPQGALITSRLSQSSRYQALLNALQETEIALEERLALYAEADPGVQDLMSKRQGQVALVQQEVARVLGEVPPQISLDESDLLTEGQMGSIDLSLVSDLVEAEVELQSLAARREGLALAEQQLQTQLNEFPSLIAEFDRIQPEIETQQLSLEQLLTIRQELSNELAQGGFNWDVVEAPKFGRKISPQPVQNILLGLVAGVFVGGALAFGREAIDKVVRTSEELKKQAALPLLGVIPEMPASEARVLPMTQGRSPANVFSLVHYQPFRDAVDLIYKTIQLTSTQTLSSLMITSALAGEGKTTLAIGLALSAARSHQRVLLIDTDLRHPSIHEQLGISNARGLSTLLKGQSRFNPIPLSLAGSNIHVLPAGPIPDDPLRLLSSRLLVQLLAYAETNYDLVILDTPVILGSADALQLASLCKGGVMVSRLDRITQADLTQAMGVLSKVNMVGVVANRYRGGSRQDGVHHADSAIAAPDQEQKVWDMAQLVLRGAGSWKRILAMSSLGAGVISIPLLQGELPGVSPDVLQPLIERTRQFSPDFSQSNQAGLDMAAQSMEAGVTSLHVPQWS
ncbi:MAG: polysaccharide biosynthesis tyrosine autokinase [Synechococcales bacterium]|nr:polysaccharide biosynthesis tyrosine autokinase [Synechococcales bacterium]